MNKNYTLTTVQIGFIKHCIGLENGRVKGNKHRKYKAWRNYFTTSGDVEEWDNLVEQGLARKADYPRGFGDIPKVYFVSKEGMKVLGEIMGVEITEDKR